MIISVHVPKTAGTSFKQVLENHFKERLRLDYDNSLGNFNYYEKKAAIIKASSKMNWLYRKRILSIGIDCIHGHFWPYKYIKFKKEKNVKFVAWLKDPIERIISNYYFWKRTPNTNLENSILKKTMIS